MIFYVDERSLNQSAFSLYSLIKKGGTVSIVIMSTPKGCNSIAVQWEDNVYFMIKMKHQLKETLLFSLN